MAALVLFRTVLAMGLLGIILCFGGKCYASVNLLGLLFYGRGISGAKI